MAFDIVWTKEFRWWQKPIGYHRLMRARRNYGKRITLGNPFRKGYLFAKKPGYQECLRGLRNVHDGWRCFVIGNGPSLTGMDLSPLRNEITIGSNEVYRLFPEMGFQTSYLTVNSPTVCENNRRGLRNVRGPIKIFGLDLAYCAPVDERTFFVNVSRREENDGMFSDDCAAIVYFGQSAVYLDLQLAFHLGCSPVYLIGLDPDADAAGGEGELSAYRRAAEFYQKHGRQIFAIGMDDRFDMFEEVDYTTLFSNEKAGRCKAGSFGLGPSQLGDVLTMTKSSSGTDRARKYYEIAVNLCHNGKPEVALEHLEKSIKCIPSARAYYLKASLKKSLGRYAESREIFLKLLLDEKQKQLIDRRIYGSSHFHLGEMDFKAGVYPEAKVNFERCLEAIPEHRKAVEYLRVINAEGCAAFSAEREEALAE